MPSEISHLATSSNGLGGAKGFVFRELLPLRPKKLKERKVFCKSRREDFESDFEEVAVEALVVAAVFASVAAAAAAIASASNSAEAIMLSSSLCSKKESSEVIDT